MFPLSDALKGFTGYSVLTIVFLLSGAMLVATNRAVARDERGVFLRSITALVVIVAIDWFTYATSGQFPELRWLHAVLMAVTFSIAPFIPVGIANVIFPEIRVRWVMIILVCHVAFQAVGICFGYVFWVDEANVYHRGPLYFVYMAVYTLSSVYLVIESVKAGRTYQSGSVLAVVSIFVCLAAGVLMQVSDTTVRTTWTAVSMAVMLYFLFYSDMVLRTDPLTKLLNRRSFEEFLAKPKFPCAVIVVDVDDFKRVNDTHGHAYGDDCLAAIAGIIRRVFGGVGMCFRTGGDEFLVVIPKQVGDVDAYMKRVHLALGRAQSGDPHLPGISMGYAVADKGCDDVAEVIREADQAMYEAKRGKKLQRT